MPIILFRSRLRAGVDVEAYAARAAELLQLAQGMPGFVAMKDFTAADGERLAVIEWASHETLKAWREHPLHRVAQGMGREQYYGEYSLQVCDLLRESRFPSD